MLQARRDLETGRGAYAHTPAGEAAQRAIHAGDQRADAERYAGGAGWRAARRLRGEAKRWQRVEDGARKEWSEAAAPEIDRLGAKVRRIEARIMKLEVRSAARDRWLGEHPEVQRDLQAVEDTITRTRLTDRVEARLESLERRAASAPDVGIDIGI